MSDKKIISARLSSPALEEFVLECIQPDVQQVLKCTADDLNSLASDLCDPDMELAEVPMPNGKDYKDCSIRYIMAVQTVMGEFLNAQKALGGDVSAQVYKLRERREAGEQIGRWRVGPRDDLQ
jgi:hypothetical protein